ncbi:hypothetical protein IKQ_05264 [Bacillus cereus VDM053]|nr:hypothetical protein IKQ_05264 [Bacillus cereus VDM053]
MCVEQLRWLPAIPCPKPMHLPPTNFAFLEEGVFLAKMIKNINGYIELLPIQIPLLISIHFINKTYLYFEKAQPIYS